MRASSHSRKNTPLGGFLRSRRDLPRWDHFGGSPMNSVPSSCPLAGKAAIVTGASSGIGEATAVALADAGARVAIVARRAERLDALAARIAGQGGSALKLTADIAIPADLERIVQATIAEWGRLDILVNNAGVMLLSTVADASTDEWRQMIEINLVALMNLCKLALPHLEASAGHIVNVSSVAGRIAN